MADRFLRGGRSWEEYHKFAYDAPRRREKTIFQLIKVIVKNPEDHLYMYPEFETFTSTVGYFSNIKETEKGIQKIIDESRRNHEMVYCFNVWEFPIGRVSDFNVWMNRPFIREYLYDENGELVHRSLASCVEQDELTPYGNFIGRPKELLKFKEGDYVEVRDEINDKAYLAILIATPQSDEEIYNRWYIKEPKNKIIRGYYSASDDLFWIIKGTDPLDVDDVPLCTVMKARFAIPEWIKKRFELYLKLDKRLESEYIKRDKLKKEIWKKMDNNLYRQIYDWTYRD